MDTFHEEYKTTKIQGEMTLLENYNNTQKK